MRPAAIPSRPEHLVLGISACLVGEAVRWDGSHRAAWFPKDAMPAWVTLRPVCPEAAIGLGIPRSPIRLEDAPLGPAVRRFGADADGIDLGPRLTAFAREQVADGDLDGFVLAPRSPSCGLSSVPAHAASGGDALRMTGSSAAGGGEAEHVRAALDVDADVDPDADADRAAGAVVALGTGAFAAGLAVARPELPRIEGPQLIDRAHRRVFLERVRIGAWWRRHVSDDARLASLPRLRAILRSRGADTEAQLRRRLAPAMLDTLLAGHPSPADQAAALALLGEAPDGIAARVLAGEISAASARVASADGKLFDDPLFWACV